MADSPPLSGIKVLDFTQNLPGPYTTFILASMGAEVIKVESPKGDPARAIEPMFSMLNGGKRSVVLDLREPSSRPALEALIGWADVLVEGFRPGVMDRLGAGWARARALNPALVYCAISAYGQTGPRVQEPGHDLNLQALSGICWLERDDDDVPRGARLPVADLSTSLVAVASICAALTSGAQGRVGRYLDVGMSDAALSWATLWGNGVDLAAPAKAALGKAPGGGVLQRLSGRLLQGLDRQKLYAMPQYGIYATRDKRHIALGIVDERHFWEAMCDVLGLARFRKLPVPARTAMGPVLKAAIALQVRRHDSADILRKLVAADVPVTLVRRPDEVADEPQFRARDLFGPRGFVRAPLPEAHHLDAPAPSLGQDTTAVLAALGVSGTP